MTKNENPAPTAPAAYTEAEALDEAVLMLVRKLNRMAPEVLAKLAPEAVEVLHRAESRADLVRDQDQAAGVALCTRPFPSQYED